jgi:CheY-like chemotaxis protein
MAKGDWVTPERPSKGTVLLVEDEASIADLVRLYLERDGFRVVWRTDGPSGPSTPSAPAWSCST